MVILNYRSSYLRRILSITNVNRNNDGSLTHIKLPNISPGIFQIILRYIYGGRVSLEEYDTSDIIEILNVIQVWEHVLKWGIAQNPRLPSVLSSYSKEDFITLENTLHHFIPFINFFSLTSKEYLDNVYPYKKIIPKDLRKNLFKYFIEQSMKDSNEILGGYNPIEWKSNLAIGDMIDSFLFSFIKIEENIEDYILSRPKEEKNVIENDSFSGPVFGNRDLELYGESYMQGCCHPGDYDTLIRKTEGFFSVEEYEVFQIKKID
ncbi:BTB/POZ protein [Rhizophagus irregularis DAOM 181602=DAOM 197198]|nr:BTB/POZ protein [Rhizophagus irregularis DAOM 181602=DAOM 197198]